MKIAYIGTYPPRQCGIGTYTRNKFLAMTLDESNEGIIIAVSDREHDEGYPEEVQFIIRQQEQKDYTEAAAFINESGADICIVEHEFGIFGGQGGVFILPLLHRLQIPFLVVLHTVLKKPSFIERNILLSMASMAARMIVMSRKAIGFLTGIYGIPRKQIELIPHGVPDLKFDSLSAKRELGLANRQVILTFGLLSRNKGIETVIRALSPAVKTHPDIAYIVLGKTHPSVLRASGEEYRDSLISLTERLCLQDHVLFVNEFVDEEKLCKYLAAADIYVTPYLNEAQITSGTLSYAVGAGCAVLSTPYWHATELLDEGRGRLFDFNDDQQLSSIFCDLLDHPLVIEEHKQLAAEYGNEISWSKIGQKYIQLAQSILDRQAWQPYRKSGLSDNFSMPPFSLDHIRRLTDNTGIIQHARYGIPDFKEGYCLDDNARALLMITMAYKQEKHILALELLPVYLSYIHYMQNNDGTFRNFLSFNREFLDECGSEDSFGRTIWALGYFINHAPNDAYYQSARDMFCKAIPNFRKIQSTRGLANTIIGISYYLQRFPSDLGMMENLKDLSFKLVNAFDQHKSGNWKWFESRMTYDNAILPLSLLHAASILNDEKVMRTAMQSIEFLSCITMKEGYLAVVGNEKWFSCNDETVSLFAQQPIDIMAMVLLFEKAYILTKNKIYLDNLHTSFMWFMGENDLRMMLFDPETKGCCDGLESYGVNRNQGAESTLAFLISHLVVLRAAGRKEGTILKNALVAANAATGYPQLKMG